ncbi:hypothetical protein AB4Z25_11805 [Rhizobium sp. RAF36]|uniref:hypothetical protein n=1 Tax=Rhizobium sp. RAF36 TaxID=3233055 RepID=UPI003F975192
MNIKLASARSSRKADRLQEFEPLALGGSGGLNLGGKGGQAIVSPVGAHFGSRHFSGSRSFGSYASGLT